HSCFSCVVQPLSYLRLLFLFCILFLLSFSFFFFNAPPPTEIYTLSLHDALPILTYVLVHLVVLQLIYPIPQNVFQVLHQKNQFLDRKSTRLNSSHVSISYAVFCLKKKKKKNIIY